MAMKPILAPSRIDHGLGTCCAHGFELVRQAIHVVDVIVFALAVLGLLVVAAAAREVGRRGWLVPGSVR
jgi:hypothetical protein